MCLRQHEQKMSAEEKRYRGRVMERDDVTVIMDGVFQPGERKRWSLKEIGRLFHDKPHDSFRQFTKNSTNDVWEEQVNSISMLVSEFLRYLERREEAQSKGGDPLSFTYKDVKTGESYTIPNVLEVVFYMIDVDMAAHLHPLLEDYLKGFKMSEILQGGEWCMLNAVSFCVRSSKVSEFIVLLHMVHSRSCFVRYS